MKNYTNNTTINYTIPTTIDASLINENVLADCLYEAGPYSLERNNVVVLISKVSELFKRLDETDKVEHGYYGDYYGRNPESCYIHKSNLTSEEWQERTDACMRNLVRSFGFLNMSCRQIIETLFAKRDSLERTRTLAKASGETFSEVESAELRRLNKLLSKYDKNDRKSYSFVTVYVTERNVVDIAAAFESAFLK